MDLAKIHTIKIDTSAPITIADAFELEQYIVINNYVSLRVEKISNSYISTNPIPITLNGVVQGYLIFTKEKEDIEIAQMTELEFISFLSFGQNTDYNNATFRFQTDFVLVKDDFFLEYITAYKHTSMIWGGFTHELIGAPISKYKKALVNIEMGIKIKDLDPYSYESCVRAIEQPYAFERFLKLYHLLELQFDYFIINKIKSLTIPADSNKIGKTLNEYSNSELLRLTEIIEFYCTNIPSLEQKLSNVSLFPSIAEEIFIDFGKSKSDIHLVNVTKFRNVVNSGSFTSANLQALKVPSSSDHTKFIINLTAYWIYRIRCSIAHNRIGEYLLSWNDENFIVEFGEPLLKEVLIQCFKK